MLDIRCSVLRGWSCALTKSVEFSSTKVPLVFETTGAMGTETQKWWKEIGKMEKDQRGFGETTSRKDLGLDWTFTANGFASYWLQSISMSMARTLAEYIVRSLHRGQPRGGRQSKLFAD